MLTKSQIFILTLCGIANLAFCVKGGDSSPLSEPKRSTKPSWLSSIGSFFIHRDNTVDQENNEFSPLIPGEKRSQILTNRELSKILLSIANSNHVTSRLPFSDFTESAVIFFRTVQDVINHEQYDTEMDVYIKQMLLSFKEITVKFNSFILPKGKSHYLAYRYVRQPVDKLKSTLSSFFEKKHKMTENKIIANFWSNVFYTGQQLYAAIDTFVLVDNMYADKTRFYFNAEKHNLSLQDSTLKIQRLVYTLSIINDITEGTYKTNLPLSSLAFYGDYMVAFTSLFEVTIKLAHYDVLLTAHRLLNDFLELDRQTSTYRVLPVNHNEEFSFDQDLKGKILDHLALGTAKIDPLCKRSEETILCETLIHHLNTLFTNIGNHALNWIDHKTYNYRFHSQISTEAFDDQALGQHIKLDLQSVVDSLADTESILYKNRGSKLAVHMNSIFSGSLSIFKQYKQSEDLLIGFIELASSSAELFDSATVKAAPGLQGNHSQFYVYEKALCDGLNAQIVSYGNLFREKVLFNHENDNPASQFYKVHMNLYEAWQMYFNDMINRRYACEEEFDIFDEKMDQESTTSKARKIKADLDDISDSDEFGEFVSAPVLEDINFFGLQVSAANEKSEINNSKIDAEGNLIEANIYNDNEDNLQQVIFDQEEKKDTGLIRKKAARQQRGDAEPFKINLQEVDEVNEEQDDALLKKKTARKPKNEPFSIILNEVKNDVNEQEEPQDTGLIGKKATRQQRVDTEPFKITLHEVESEIDEVNEEQDDALLKKKAARQPKSEPFSITLNEVDNEIEGLEEEQYSALVRKKAARQATGDSEPFKINLKAVENEVDNSSIAQENVSSEIEPNQPRRIIRKIIFIEMMNCGMCLNDLNLRSFVFAN